MSSRNGLVMKTTPPLPEYGSLLPRQLHVDAATAPTAHHTAPQDPVHEANSHTYPDSRQTSLLARLFFLWFEPLVEIASRRRVQASDVWDLPEEYRSKRAYEEFLAVYKSTGSLVWSIARCYWPYFAKSAVLAIASVAFSIAHPLLLYAVVRISMYAEPREEVVLIIALLAGILVASVTHSTLHRHSLKVLLLASTKAVGAIETLLFDRAIGSLRPPSSSSSSTTPQTSSAGISSSNASFLFHELGKIYHVMSIIHTPWVYTLHVSANLYMLYLIIGDAFVVSIVSAVAAQAVALVLMSLDTKSSHRWTHSRAERIQVVSECVKSIQTIKLHAWETRFLRRIQVLRDDEVDASTQHLAVAVVTRSILAVLPEIIMIFTFAGLTFSDKGLTEFDPASVFATVAIVNRLHATFTVFITNINDLARAYVYLKHLEVVLHEHEELHERCSKRCERTMMPCPSSITASMTLIHQPQVRVHVSNAMVARTLEEPLLVNTNLLVRKGELVVIHGKVGSGKSTFLRALVGDALQLNRRGAIDVKGKIAYCSQTPWLQTLSIRENILFGEPFDEKKYLNVLHACCLLRDLAALPGGDKTVVGPKGLNISGGQKARICLARACYADADVYLLDAPLSSVDAIVQSDIFTRCFVELLKYKTVVLVTHNLEIVTSPFVDQVVRIDDHQFVHETALGRVSLANPQLSYRPRRSMKTRKLPGQRGQSNESAPSHESDAGMESNNRSGDGADGLLLTSYEGSRVQAKWRKIASKVDTYIVRDEMDPVLRPEVVSEYVALCGSGWFLIPLGLTAVLARVSLVASDIWICLWSEEVAQNVKTHGAAGYREDDKERQTDVVIYATLIVGAAAMTFYGSVLTMQSCTEAANKLFTKMVSSVIHAPMSFFYSRPIGEIVNRFSGDVVRVDSRIQELLFKNATSLAGIVIPSLVLMVLTPEMILVLPVVAYLVYRNRFHLRIALEMLRHSIASLSPCYNSIEEYVEGRRVIQAFGWSQVDRFRRLHQQQLDRLLKMNYAYGIFKSWSVLQFMKIDMLLIGVLILCPFRRDMNPVVLGLALNYIFLMNSQLFNWYSSALDLGTSFLMVDRIVEYADMAPDDESSMISGRQTAVPAAWPTRGAIVFDRASFQYNSASGPVVKNISLHISPGEKIGLVGRTGAGKSSLTMALFRIHELVAGRILIDDIDIALVDVHTLRSRLSIIPQSPLFFQGTLRSYLDPFEDADDAELWTALRKTGLGDAVSKMEGKLSAALHENAENLSQGERQLLCLSRVMLKQSTVVVLDEATAAIDHDSDESLQGVLQREFKGATVISIAHRLDSILEFDRVVVMDEGRVVQCGTVEELVADVNGPFFDLLEGSLLRM